MAKVRAAGGVLWREVDGEVRVAVVHRPRYDDWSLPKGKLDPGELEVAAAVREVEEETGFACVVGRFLEHSRVLAFGDPAEGEVEHWLGSADLMHRNLDRRVETLVRLKDPVVQRQVDALFDRAMRDDTRHWALQSDGCWEQRPTSGPARDMQADLIRRSSERGAG